MQEPRASPLLEVSNTKPRQKKPPNKKPSGTQTKGKPKGGKTAAPLPSRETQKGSKRGLKNDASTPYQQADRSTPDSLPDASGTSDEYRILRRKYLLLEEESFSLGRVLTEAEQEVKALEDEKSALLDQLVVLEGLLDPSELRPQGGL